MLEGDALRSLGRIEEAADAYRRAVGELPPPRRQQAGFLEARLRSGELGDPEGALSALRRAGVTAAGSPLRERAMALEAQLHHRLGNTMELRAVAAAYLGDYPNGSRANEMRGYLRE
jgi:tetratricopeptide (TPR) repeat protein